MTAGRWTPVGKGWPQRVENQSDVAENWWRAGSRPREWPSERNLDGWQELSDLWAGWLQTGLDVAEGPGAHNLLKLGAKLDQEAQIYRHTAV